MSTIPYKTLFTELGKNEIKYLVADGFAVNFHQIQRATADLDLIVHLEKENVEKFIGIMTKLRYKPRLPVDAKDFAVSEKRESWIREKNMTVFTFINPKNAFDIVDIFAHEPKPFEQLNVKKLVVSAFGTQIPVLGIDDLIEMKEKAGRDKDMFDAKQLRKKKTVE